MMPDIDHERTFRDYYALLMMMTAIGLSAEERAARAAALAGSTDPLLLGMADGLRLDAYELQRLYMRRAATKAAWAAFFREWDVLVCPTALSAAFPHATGRQQDRTLRIDGQDVPYMLNIVYPMWAIFTGQPATAFPAGADAQGLPLGLQAIGPYLEDRTTLRFAQLLEREWLGFVPPPAYRA